MERHGGDRRTDHSAAAPPFPADGGPYHNGDRKEHCNDGNLQHQQQDHRHHHNFNGQQNESTGYHLNGDSNSSLPLSGQKRPFPHSNNADYGGFVKLYVVGIPRTASEMDVSAVFGEIGDIIEVVLLRDKRTGVKQECCFVKYATIEQAEKAMAVFNSQFTFPGAYTLELEAEVAKLRELNNELRKNQEEYMEMQKNQVLERENNKPWGGKKICLRRTLTGPW